MEPIRGMSSAFLSCGLHVVRVLPLNATLQSMVLTRWAHSEANSKKWAEHFDSWIPCGEIERCSCLNKLSHQKYPPATHFQKQCAIKPSSYTALVDAFTINTPLISVHDMESEGTASPREQYWLGTLAPTTLERMESIASRTQLASSAQYSKTKHR